jgi:hypothetical protein
MQDCAFVRMASLSEEAIQRRQNFIGQRRFSSALRYFMAS